LQLKIKKSCSTISELISGSQKHETVSNRQFSEVLAFGKFFLQFPNFTFIANE
jgi:hypothetical protein